jgi:distribution and morphology protein 10
MNALPSLNGSIGYLFTSEALDIGTSGTVDFQDMVDQFRIKRPSRKTRPPTASSSSSSKNYLVYGRMFFPGAALETMYVRRLSPQLQYLITAVNHPRDPGLPQVNGKSSKEQRV